jgi:hypothetical protein
MALNPLPKSSGILSYFSVTQGLTPGNLTSLCNGCGAKFNIRHALGCKVGGLVIRWHNKTNKELSDLASKALVPSAVCVVERMIQTKHTVEGPSAGDQYTSPVQGLSCSIYEERGDLLIYGFWSRGTDILVDVVQMTDTDSKSYWS